VTGLGERWSPAEHRVTYAVQVNPMQKVSHLIDTFPSVAHVHTIDIEWQWRTGEYVPDRPWLVALRTGNPRTGNRDGLTIYLPQLAMVPEWLSDIIERSRPRET